MSDIALNWLTSSADFAIEANDLARDDGLETAVLISLFTDRRAEPGDVIPDGQTDRRGWWGDEVLPPAPQDRIGSRLWLLARSKNEAEVLRLAPDYARESLQWLVDDRVATAIDVEVSVPQREVLGLAVTIDRPKLDPVTYRYHYTWAAQEARRAA